MFYVEHHSCIFKFHAKDNYKCLLFTAKKGNRRSFLTIILTVDAGRTKFYGVFICNNFTFSIYDL